MRIYGNLDLARINLRLGRQASRVAGAKFRGSPMRAPARGTLLKTLRITDHVRDISYVVTLHQGDRINNIEPRLFGQNFVRSIYCGFDTLFRELRRRWKIRWIVEN